MAKSVTQISTSDDFETLGEAAEWLQATTKRFVNEGFQVINQEISSCFYNKTNKPWHAHVSGDDNVEGVADGEEL